jgi:hypothetical protein
MERGFTNFAGATGMRVVYHVRVADLPDADDCEHSLWNKLLGLVTMVVVSAGGWFGVIELVRHLL